MYSKICTCVLQGLNGHIVEVETDLSRGMPVFNIVGGTYVPSKAEQKAERFDASIPVSETNMNLGNCIP